jgi:hypothetical protein
MLTCPICKIPLKNIKKLNFNKFLNDTLSVFSVILIIIALIFEINWLYQNYKIKYYDTIFVINNIFLFFGTIIYLILLVDEMDNLFLHSINIIMCTIKIILEYFDIHYIFLVFALLFFTIRIIYSIYENITNYIVAIQKIKSMDEIIKERICNGMDIV